jgi:hypothetical protein
VAELPSFWEASDGAGSGVIYNTQTDLKQPVKKICFFRTDTRTACGSGVQRHAEAVFIVRLHKEPYQTDNDNKLSKGGLFPFPLI